MSRSTLPTPEAFADCLRHRLLSEPESPDVAPDSIYGDHRIAGFHPPPEQIARAVPAAVLAPVVYRDGVPHLILTERSEQLAKHSGQVAFPGGRMDPGETPVVAALREAQEEIGLDPALVTTLGFLPYYYVGTGFRITPVVGLVDSAARFEINPAEVARVFETPLTELFDRSRHRIDSRMWEGRRRHFYVIDHETAYIWGATAAMIRLLSERLVD